MTETNFEYDIFISYAHIDNKTRTKDQEGWIARLHQDLDLRLNQLLGEKPKIWRDNRLGGSDYFNEVILNALVKTAILVSVLSPRYVKSEWCIKEGEEFINAAEQNIGFRINNKARILKVIKTPLLIGDHIDKELKSLDNLDEELKSRGEKFCAEIRQLLSYEFFEVDPVTGHPREFMDFSGKFEREYWEKLEDLAYEIRQLLEILKTQQPPPASGVTVYLAETTSDLRAERDQIRRELLTRGHTVLPDRPLPLFGPELENLVRENLERCNLSIHLIGGHYGILPENANRSIVELQNVLSIERSRQVPNFSRLIWLPIHLLAKDERQKAFVTNLQDNPGLQRGDDLLQTTLEDLKTTIQDKLKSIQNQSEGSNSEGEDDGITRVYLICAQRDLDDTVPLDNYLYDQGFEVLLPLFEGDEADVTGKHQENLRICDAVLIYYGHANEAWLWRKVSDLRKASGYGRSTPIPVKAVYVTSPEDRHKARYRSREVDAVIKNFGEFSPDDLRPFLSKLAEQKGDQE